MAKFCSDCGTGLEEGDRFCVTCGATVGAAAPAVIATPSVAAAPSAPVPAPVVAPPARSGGVPLARQVLTALVYGGFIGAAGYAHTRSADAAIGWAAGGAALTFGVLVALTLVRWVLTAPFRRGRPVAAGGALIGVGGVIVLLLSGSVLAAAAYVVGPDVPPGLIDLDAIADNVSALTSRADPAESVLKGSSLRDAEIARFLRIPPSPDEQRAAAVKAQLQASRLPVSTVGFVETEGAGRVMVVGLDVYSLTGPDLGAGLGVLVELGRSDRVDLAGLEAVSVGMHDRDGRVLFAMSAPTKAIADLRAKRIDRTAFIRAMSLRTESRLGIVDAYRELAGR